MEAELAEALALAKLMPQGVHRGSAAAFAFFEETDGRRYELFN
jgi:hypothetical protein